jgi:hypothetical protein
VRINLTPTTKKPKIGLFNNISYSKHFKEYNIRSNDYLLKKIVCLLLISLIFTTHAQATQTVVSISYTSAESGGDVIATILLNNVLDYGTGTVRVTYDPSIVQVIGVEGSTDSVITTWNADNDGGSVLISACNTDGKSGEVIFAVVKFQAVASSGLTPLSLDVEILQDTSYNEITTALDPDSLSITESAEPNGYKGDKPLTIFSHDIFTGDLNYTTGDSTYSGKLYSDDEYHVNHAISIPAAATVTFARLYTYWTWSALGSTGRYPDLKLTFDGNELSPNGNYTDRKGFEPYDYPSGTWAYDITDYVTGNGDHTTVIENIGPAGSYFAVNGVGLLVVYTDPNGDEIECWIAEGCDCLSSQSESGLTPEEATTQIVFPGTINLLNIEEAKLTTVVQSGNDVDNMLAFNLKNWTGIYNGTPYADLDVDGRDVLDYLVDNNNTAEMMAVDDYMAPSNAFLVLRRTSPESEPASNGSTVSLTSVIVPEIFIEVTASSVDLQVHITNKATTTINVTAEVTDSAQNLYVEGLRINNEGWSVFQTQLIPYATEMIDLQLRVPVDYTGVGEKEGELVFWAQKV